MLFWLPDIAWSGRTGQPLDAQFCQFLGTYNGRWGDEGIHGMTAFVVFGHSLWIIVCTYIFDIYKNLLSPKRIEHLHIFILNLKFFILCAGSASIKILAPLPGRVTFLLKSDFY